MINDDPPEIFYLVVIAGRKQKDSILSALCKSGGHITNFFFGSAATKVSNFMDLLGFVRERENVIITCLTSSEEVDSIFNMLNKDFGFDKPKTGIAFTIPVEKLSY